MFQQEKVSLENRVALIIESEITKFKYIEKMLTSSGFVVHQAVSITQGLDFISETPDIHAVMVNESMFNRTDNDETKQFKSISPTLPLILIGNKQNEHDVPSKAILEEPINYKELLSVLS
jgi:DNA-binding NtrC family response regulator